MADDNRITKQELEDFLTLTNQHLDESADRIEAGVATTLAGFEQRMLALFQERVDAMEAIPDAKIQPDTRGSGR